MNQSINQEEFDRYDGFWLSPGGGRVAFEQVDDSHIPAYRITHQGEDPGLSAAFAAKQQASTSSSSSSSSASSSSSYELLGDTTVTFEETRFPFSGAKNPSVKLGVAPTGTDVSEVIRPLI